MGVESEFGTCIENMLEEVDQLKHELETSTINKSAAYRARKITLNLEKLGKEFRKLSIAYSKE